MYPDAWYQRCTVHFYRHVFSVVFKSKSKAVATMLKAIHAAEDQAVVRENALAMAEKLREMKVKEAAKKIEESVSETLADMDFPREHWLKIRSNNAIERLNRDPAPGPCSRHFPGWPVGPDAGLCPAALHGRLSVGQQDLIEHEAP